MMIRVVRLGALSLLFLGCGAQSDPNAHAPQGGCVSVGFDFGKAGLVCTDVQFESPGYRGRDPRQVEIA